MLLTFSLHNTYIPEARSYSRAFGRRSTDGDRELPSPAPCPRCNHVIISSYWHREAYITPCHFGHENAINHDYRTYLRFHRMDDDHIGHIWQIGANGLMFFFIFLCITEEEEETPHDRITR